jgi:hypothetical protein
MTAFEQFLLDKGYIGHKISYKGRDMFLTTPVANFGMNNLTTHYIHESNVDLLEKIKQGLPLSDKGISIKDRKGEIVFGLSSGDRPPTLIYPRPRIEVKRKQGDGVYIYDEQWDDNMNVAFQEKTNEEIFEAMYDSSICWKFDLT